MKASALLERLWNRFGFTPNDNQRAAILHVDGPLYLPAGPGSGKTRVLLWRTVNLIATEGVDPRQIFLSTFTEKAAHQLREGLRGFLGAVTEETGKPYDLSRMFVGTVHSLCQRLVTDRDFQPGRRRGRAPVLLDELDQFLFVSRRGFWQSLLDACGLSEDTASRRINSIFGDSSASRYLACTNAIAMFNRLSEECIEPPATAADPDTNALLRMYGRYREHLRAGRVLLTDFSLLQHEALRTLEAFAGSSAVFRHVIVDEYQDTNTVQERLFFRLSGGHKNLCVVGDDDQALYRFRGATVENFVQFPVRCENLIGRQPREIPLDVNYRSRPQIVGFSSDFMLQCDWQRHGQPGSYRVAGKDIKAFRNDKGVAVVATNPRTPPAVYDEIADLVHDLIAKKKVADPNQTAFLFPSLKSPHAERMIQALEQRGLRTYAPRAKGFLHTSEAQSTLGVLARILGRPERGPYRGGYGDYYDWLEGAEAIADSLIGNDRALARFVSERSAEVARARSDYAKLVELTVQRKWALDGPYDETTMKRALSEEAGISDHARRKIVGRRFEWIVRARREQNNPVNLLYALKRASSIDWSLLDIFYQLCLFKHWAEMFDAAQRKDDPDEGPVANLGLLTGYISRFMEQRAAIVTGDLLREDILQGMLFGSYLYAMFRRGESEFEDADDPFPKGRIPFLTIHQAKGLEFPVVVLGNPRKDDRGPQAIEELVRPLLVETDGVEPLDRLGKFDIMRMFYVALSRAKNLLVVARYSGAGQRTNGEFIGLLNRVRTIDQFDADALPPADEVPNDIPSVYSYTGDYLAYQRCPRQYMIFRKFDFVPSRGQTMVFGTLVHRTLDDLHQYIIASRVSM
jgi:DNA helicase-2/ATP-dependent DNA helicase PcrA